VDAAVADLARHVGGLQGTNVLVLGLTYREGVRELAYSHRLAFLKRLVQEGAPSKGTTRF
jgi:UDP-N-acetyl-D-mannosaminuronate dehydrogenase